MKIFLCVESRMKYFSAEQSITIKKGVSLILLLSIVIIGGVRCSNMMDQYKENDNIPATNVILPSGDLKINNNDVYTLSRDVAINLNVQNADEMRFSADGISWTGWESYSNVKNITLPEGHGSRTVYGEFRKDGGASVLYSDMIIPLYEQKIVAYDGAAYHYFGGSEGGGNPSNIVQSEKGDVIFVGATGYSSTMGAVYVYRWSGTSWNESKLTPSDGVASDIFGFSIACTPDGSTVAITSLRKPATYIYRWNGSSWDETILSCPPGSVGNDFGVCASISADGTKLAVGSYKFNTSSDIRGAVYFYQYNGSTWNRSIITPPETELDIFFGFSVAISKDGSTMIVGAPRMNDGALTNCGAVYVYKWTGSAWNFSTKIMASDRVTGDQFGRMVSVSSDGLIFAVGMRTTFATINNNQGAVYIFKWDGAAWGETRLDASDGLGGDRYGFTLALSDDGNSLVVGAFNRDSRRGKSYLYRYNGLSWSEIILSASDGAASTNYGYQVSISGDGSTVVVGTPYNDIGSNARQGSIYIY